MSTPTLHSPRHFVGRHPARDHRSHRRIWLDAHFATHWIVFFVLAILLVLLVARTAGGVPLEIV